KAKQAPPPANLPEEGVKIGKSVFRGGERIVPILRKDRRRHFYIIGQTGTGKSVLLQEMIRQDIEAGEGLALIDPHGDLAGKILELIPPARAEDVIYFNPSDVERPLGLNMLEFDPDFPESKTFVVNEVLEIFEKLYNLKTMGFGGPVFEQYMRNAILLTMEDPLSGNTLIEISKVMADANFRKYKLSRCKNVVVKNFWELEAEKAGGEAALANMVPYITSKMNVFIANDLVRPIIAQQRSSFSFREVMDNGKILIINLSKGKLGDINSYLLGMIIVGKILIASFSRADIPEEQRRDFYLYIDEFHNVTTKTIASSLAEARKYKLNMIFAHQFIGQLDEETRKAIFGNVGSMLALRVGPDDAQYLTTQFGPVFNENDLVNLDNYNSALRLLINGETSRAFNIITSPPSKGNPEVARLIKELSQIKYGRDRAKVEAELYQRLRRKD
ncbi:type IV secretion system DNA-binding domain-containing protein, partial [Patescibacteria group bacterium]|nr:type IV secretion system DNA-binding domain-containing protein [Patescibacteria group bacterium]